MPQDPWAALLLAGGASRRFGGIPKASLRVGSESAIRRMVRLSMEEGLDPVTVVVGVHQEAVQRELADLDARIIFNEAWELGRTGSVQLGLTNLPSNANVLLWPVDHPFVEAKTLRALLSTGVSDRMATWIIPTFEGRGGHPVLFRPSAAREISALAPEASLRTVVHRLGPQVRRLPVEDPFVLANIDSWEDYSRTASEWVEHQEDPWTVG